MEMEMELEKRVIKIQSVFRGHLVRKFVDEAKEEVAMIKRELAESQRRLLAEQATYELLVCFYCIPSSQLEAVTRKC